MEGTGFATLVGDGVISGPQIEDGEKSANGVVEKLYLVGKPVDHWLVNKETQEHITALCEITNTRKSGYWKIRRGAGGGTLRCSRVQRGPGMCTGYSLTVPKTLNREHGGLQKRASKCDF
jgi:hypothetical protein